MLCGGRGKFKRSPTKGMYSGIRSPAAGGVVVHGPTHVHANTTVGRPGHRPAISNASFAGTTTSRSFSAGLQGAGR